MIQGLHYKYAKLAILDARNAPEVQLLAVLVKLATIYMNKIASQLARMAITQKQIQENVYYVIKHV